MAVAADCRSDPVSAARFFAVANTDAVPSSGLDGAPLVLAVARQWPVPLAQTRPVVNQGEPRATRASPRAGVIDNQSIKTTKSGVPQVYDAGKKIKGHKRYIVPIPMAIWSIP